MTASPSPEVTVQSLGLEDPVDEWARLSKEVSIALAPWQAKIKRLEDLREHFLKLLPPSMRGVDPGFIDGLESRLLISVCDFRREVTLAGKRKLKRLWGAAEFLDRCQIAASQLPDPKDKKGLYTTNERRGSRHLTAIPRPTEAALQAA